MNGGQLSYKKTSQLFQGQLGSGYITRDSREFLGKNFLCRFVRWPTDDARVIQIFRHWSGFNLQLLSPDFGCSDIRPTMQRHRHRTTIRYLPPDLPKLFLGEFLVSSDGKIKIGRWYKGIRFDCFAATNPPAK